MMISLILTSLITFTLSLEAKIIPPNYNFKFDVIRPFLPGSTWNAPKGKAQLLSSKGAQGLWRHELMAKRYKLILFIQTEVDKITQVYIKLPSSFLHDIFLQMLHNRYKKQNVYRTYERSAVYEWSEAKGLFMVYKASCSITCFPDFIYFSEKSTPFKKGMLGKWLSGNARKIKLR